MKILGKIAAALLVLVSLTACATSEAKKSNPADNYTFRHRNFDLKYAWKTSQTDQGVRVDGLIKNIRYSRMENLTLRVSLLNKGRQIIAESSSFPSPQQIQLDDISTFGLLLKNTKLSGDDLLRFQINYTASEGTNALSWTSDFTVYAVKGTLVGIGADKTEEEW